MCVCVIQRFRKVRVWVCGRESRHREQCNRYLYSNHLLLLLLMEMYHVEKAITRQDEGLSSYGRNKTKKKTNRTKKHIRTLWLLDCVRFAHCAKEQKASQKYCQQNFNSFLRTADTIVKRYGCQREGEGEGEREAGEILISDPNAMNRRNDNILYT